MGSFSTLTQRWLQDMGEVWRALQGEGRPELEALPGLLVSVLVSVVLFNLLLACTMKRGRTAVLQFAESVVVIALLVFLVAFVVLLPVGLVYLGGKGIVFVWRSLLATFPVLKLKMFEVLEPLTTTTAG
jgi:hypothetical protein